MYVQYLLGFREACHSPTKGLNASNEFLKNLKKLQSMFNTYAINVGDRDAVHVRDLAHRAQPAQT